MDINQRIAGIEAEIAANRAELDRVKGKPGMAGRERELTDYITSLDRGLVPLRKQAEIINAPPKPLPFKAADRPLTEEEQQQARQDWESQHGITPAMRRATEERRQEDERKRRLADEKRKKWESGG